MPDSPEYAPNQVTRPDPKSDCCQAPVEVAGGNPQDPDDPGATYWNRCTQCGGSC